MKSKIRSGILVSILGASLQASFAYAYGPHEGLDCLGCHDPHYAKAQKLFKVNNTLQPNPRTGGVIDGISALCLGCHNLTEAGGAGVKPVYLHMTHPVNVKPNPKVAKMPESLTRDGMIQCVSCHDPHPSNKSWRYLRMETDGGANVGKFCMGCHPAKTDGSFYKTEVADIKIFSSMNEETGAKQFSANDPAFAIANQTPNYVRAIGDYPNELGPAYNTVPLQDWFYAPDKNRLPQEMKHLFKDAAATAPAAAPADAAAPATAKTKTKAK